MSDRSRGCQLCQAGAVDLVLDLGQQVVSSFFKRAPVEDESRHVLRLVQCTHCGLVQLQPPLSHHDLVPPYDWISAREPEAHLDTVVDLLCQLPDARPSWNICGLTAKDSSTLERLRARDFTRVRTIDLWDDLGAQHPNAGIETVQYLTEPARMAQLAGKRGQVDLLIARHIIEHAEDLRRFVLGLRELVRPGGYLLIEAPDSSANLRACDYTMIWEEHSLYFTPATFRHALSSFGFEMVEELSFPFAYEDSLVQIARRSAAPQTNVLAPADAKAMPLTAHYRKQFTGKSERVRALLSPIRAARGGLALFGAGHLSCAFVNYHGLADLFEFVADDTPQKQGLFLPGSRLPIVPSARLVQDRIALCLLGISPESEPRVIANNQAFVTGGGEFRSLLAASPRGFHQAKGAPSQTA